MSVRYICSIVLFRSFVSLSVLCLKVLSVVESRVLKFPAIVLLFISAFGSVFAL